MQLENECIQRNLKFDDAASDDDLRNLLIEDDNKPPNWGGIYAQLMRQYHMDYDSIKERTLPQIRALNEELPEQLAIDRIAIPGIFGGIFDDSKSMPKPDRPPKLSEFISFANAFNVIK